MFTAGNWIKFDIVVHNPLHHAYSCLRHRKTIKRWKGQSDSEKEGWAVNHIQKHSKEWDSNNFVLMYFKETFNKYITINNLYIANLCELCNYLCKFWILLIQTSHHIITTCQWSHFLQRWIYRSVKQTSHTCQQKSLLKCATYTIP